MAETPNRPQPDSPMSDILAYINQNFDVIDSQDRTKIIKNGSTPTLLLGYQKNGFNGKDYGLKISKPGVDVTTATNDQLIFNSSQNVFKVRQSGTYNFVVPDGSGGYIAHYTIPHGLSYVPAVLGYALVLVDDDLIGDFWYPLPFTFNGFEWSIIADDTNVYLRLVIPAPGPGTSYPDQQFRYYILEESLS